MTTTDVPVRSRRTWTGVSGRRPPASGRVLTYAALGAISLLVLVPIVWMVLSSFKTRTELARRPPALLPHAFGLDNYTRALSAFDFLIRHSAPAQSQASTQAQAA